MISFVLAEIDHTATEAVMSEALPDGVEPERVMPDEWSLLTVTDGDHVPELVPPQLRAEVARELGERKAGELARRLEVRGLPHAAVHLANRPSAQVHILGQSRLVFASGLASPRRLSYVIAALIAAAIVVVLIVLVAHGG